MSDIDREVQVSGFMAGLLPLAMEMAEAILPERSDGDLPYAGEVPLQTPAITHHEAGQTFLSLLTAGAISFGDGGRPVPGVNRCPGCGKRISQNKPCCLSCGLQALEEDAKYIRTSDEMEAYLGQLDASERDEARAVLQRILVGRFSEVVEPSEKPAAEALQAVDW